MRVRRIVLIFSGLSVLLALLVVPFNGAASEHNHETRERAQENCFDPSSGAYQPPVPFDPNQQFQFHTAEICERVFGWSSWNTTGIKFETPSAYNSTSANITFRVSNTTVETRTIIDQSGSDGFTTPQAQGFELSQGMFLQGFSVFVYARPQTAAYNWSIRAESPGGPIMREVLVTLPTSTNQWYYVALPSPLFLPVGHYYVYCPAISSVPRSKWMRTGTGAAGDCYIQSGNWQLQDRNLTLRIHVKSLIDPESVQMNIYDLTSNQSVVNLGDGTGWANLTVPITGNSINFSITNSSPIEYSYSGYLTSYRSAKAVTTVNLTNGVANWTLLGFSYPGTNYSHYQGNISGFNENHTMIQAFLGQTVVGFSRPAPYTTLIFSSAVDRITFESINYVTQVEMPSEVYSNQNVILNVTVGTVGNISVNIYSGTGSIYINNTFSDGTTGFRWHVDTAIAAGEYTLEVIFFMPNQVGFFQLNIIIRKVAVIDTYTLHVQALDLMRLNFRLFDQFAGSTIDGANVSYYFTDLTGLLQHDISGNYTKDVNLETYSFRPGSYTLFLEAEKSGYQSLLVSMPVEILTREIDLGISRSATSLVPGSFLEISVTPRDRLTGGNLLRPTDVNITIYRAGGDPGADAIATGWMPSITSLESQSFAILETMKAGYYDILVQVQGPYYSGSIVYANGLRIEEPPNTWLTSLIGISVGMVGSGTYVQRKKVQSKRSLKGVFLMNPGGTLIDRRVSSDFSEMNPHLISGAVMGIVTMVKEMTGSSIHTIALEGRYLKFALHDSFWVVLIMQKNPAWISATIKHLVDEIEERYGAQLKAWKGENNVRIPLDDLLLRWFGVEIHESRDPTLELESRETAETRAIESGSSIGNENPKKN